MSLHPFHYFRPDELMTLDVTNLLTGVTVTGTTDDATKYPPGALCDGIPGRFVLGPAGGGLVLTVVGRSQAGTNGAALINHNLRVAAALSGGVTAAFPGPTIGANRIALNPWVTFTPATVAGCVLTIAANPAVVAVGELVVGKMRSLARNFRRDTMLIQPRTFRIDPGSEFDSVMPYPKGLAARVISGANTYSNAELADLQAWFDSTDDGSLPTYIIPDGDDSGADCWSVKFTQFDITRLSNGNNEVAFGFEETPRSRY